MLYRLKLLIIALLRFYKIISIFIIFMVIQQSVVGLVDQHQSHQSNFNTGISLIETQRESLAENRLISDQDHTDCEHCCHCHNLSLYYFSYNTTISSTGSNISLLLPFDDMTYDQLYLTPYKPPKS